MKLLLTASIAQMVPQTHHQHIAHKFAHASVPRNDHHQRARGALQPTPPPPASQWASIIIGATLATFSL